MVIEWWWIFGYIVYIQCDNTKMVVMVLRCVFFLCYLRDNKVLFALQFTQLVV